MCFDSFIENIIDALFWLTKKPASQGCVQDEEYVLNGTLQAVQVAVKIEEIEKTSSKEEELKVVWECLRKGDCMEFGT